MFENNMSIDFNKIFSGIDFCIRNANYDKAIEGLKLLKPTVVDSSSKLSRIPVIKEGDKGTDFGVTLVLNYSGFSIDCGSEMNDVSIIEEGMGYAKGIFKKLNQKHKLYSTFGYNIANGYGSLLQIKQHSSEQHYWIGDIQTEETKKLYRTILLNMGDNDDFILPILTNYANLLNGSLGRIIESLHFYNRVIKLEPKLSMALSNKGYVQSLFASVVYGDVKGIILREAYCNIKKAIEIGLDAGPKKYFEGVIDNIIKRMFPDVASMG